MKKILDKVNYPCDLKKLSIEEKKILAQEIRDVLIQTVTKTGGHLASNLGVVELTIALHSVFDTPKDKIVFDVGHQTYVHKILTGRKAKFDTLRQMNGISGFPKAKESEYDIFDTGHSSSSISIALGLARARDLKENENYVVSVIGDGALTGGMAFEALNDAGSSMRHKFIVVLNDNEMSISKNVGGLAKFLTKIRTKNGYRLTNTRVRKIFEKIPLIGSGVIKLVTSIKYGVMKMALPNMIFEDLDFRYLGPIDGNNIDEVENTLKLAKKEKDKPVFVHVITKKGKGFKEAEERPDKYHSVSPNKSNSKDYSYVFGNYLTRLAKSNKKIVAVTAAMTDGTGLRIFKETLPDRFFDVGIAEQNAVTMAAGMAKEGMLPFVSIYSSFYERCYDQVINDVCLQDLPVCMLVDRAGIVGSDGETHQGIYDLAFLNAVPSLTVAIPKDFLELEKMLDFAIELKQPIAIRYPKGSEDTREKFNKCDKISQGKAEVILSGKEAKITIIAIGKMVAKAVIVSKMLEKEKIATSVVNARFLDLKNDKELIQMIKKSKLVVTIEDGIVCGGFGTNIQTIITENNIKTKLKIFGYPKQFIEHGTVQQIEEKYGLDEVTICEEIKKILKNM